MNPQSSHDYELPLGFYHTRKHYKCKQVPSDEVQSFSCFLYTPEVEHGDLGQMSEAPLNHYHRSRQSPKKAEKQHPKINEKQCLIRKAIKIKSSQMTIQLWKPVPII